MREDVWAIVLAAGSGLRAGGGTPKQYQRLGDRTVLARALDLFERSGMSVVVVADDPVSARAAGADECAVVRRVVKGGTRRQDSVAAGLQAVPDDVPVVVVHDAARPFATPDLLEAGLAAVAAGADGAVPSLEISDTVKVVTPDGHVLETLKREMLRAVQTPQVFRASVLRRAHAQFAADATDDAAMVEATGGDVVVVSGDPSNVKLTYAADLEAAERRDLEAEPDGDRAGVRVSSGLGFDVHAFGGSGPVRLGGLDIPHDRGLAGHSDGDVLVHAVVDALLGAAGLGDIGQRFPDSEPEWEDADSIGFLEKVAADVFALGWTLSSVDTVVMCEAPRISPHREEIRDRLAAAMRIAPERVNVKGTTSEKLGFTGRGEGIAAQAIATLTRMGG